MQENNKKEEYYYNQIKNILIENEAYKKVKDYSKNRHDLMSYYNVGKNIIEAQGGETRAKYGDQLIKKYFEKLINESIRGYSVTSLKRMRQLFLLIQKGAPMVHLLSWSHYIILMTLKDINEINYYIDQCIQFNLGKRQLHERIKQKEYERLPENTKNKLIKKEETAISDFIKNPIVITNHKNRGIASEKILKNLILENLDNFLEQLGSGFTYIKNEYKISVDNRYNYIDLLLFNIEYLCYVVVELKVTELKKEHIGQIHIYMNYIDKNIKKENHNNTIGLIIAKKNNQYVIDYCSDERILFREYFIL